MAEKTPPKSHRLSLDVSHTVKEQLDKVEKRTDAVSMTEVVRRSLSLYDLATEHQKQGGRVIFQNSDGTSETLKVL